MGSWQGTRVIARFLWDVAARYHVYTPLCLVLSYLGTFVAQRLDHRSCETIIQLKSALHLNVVDAFCREYEKHLARFTLFSNEEMAPQMLDPDSDATQVCKRIFATMYTYTQP